MAASEQVPHARPARPHPRNRPYLGGTVDARTRQAALAWIQAAPPRGQRSVGKWVDRLLERAEGFDRERDAREALLKRKTRAQIRAILACAGRLSLGCEPPQQNCALAEIRAAAREIDRLLPLRRSHEPPLDPDYQI